MSVYFYYTVECGFDIVKTVIKQIGILRKRGGPRNKQKVFNAFKMSRHLNCIPRYKNWLKKVFINTSNKVMKCGIE